MTRIILSNGPIETTDAIVIDHGNCCFWQRTERRPWIGGRREANRRFRTLTALLVRAPYVLTWDELIDAVWGDDPTGGPDNPRGHIGVILTQARPLLKWLGGKTVTMSGVGIHFEFYPVASSKTAVAA